jgi:hypothetical protein
MAETTRPLELHIATLALPRQRGIHPPTVQAALADELSRRLAGWQPAGDLDRERVLVPHVTLQPGMSSRELGRAIGRALADALRQEAAR